MRRCSAEVHRRGRRLRDGRVANTENSGDQTAFWSRNRGLAARTKLGAVAHVPALGALSDDYEIVGVADTSRASAEAAAASCDICFEVPDILAAVTTLM